MKKRYGRPRFDEDGHLKYRTIVNNSVGDPSGVHGSLNDHCFVESFDKLELGQVARFARKAVAMKRRQPGRKVEACLVDAAAAFPSWPIRACDVQWCGVRFFDPRVPLPEYAKHRAPTPEEEERDTVFLFAQSMQLGTRSSMFWYCLVAEAINFLHRHPHAPMPTALPVDENGKLLFETEFYVDDSALCAYADVGAAVKERLFEVYDLIGDRNRLVALDKDELDGRWESIKVFTGIEVDIEEEELRMPVPRVEAGLEQIDAMLGRSYCKFKDLESLVGTLGFASRTLPRSKTFMRRMYDLLSSRTAKGRKPAVSAPDHAAWPSDEAGPPLVAPSVARVRRRERCARRDVVERGTLVPTHRCILVAKVRRGERRWVRRDL